MTAAPRDTVQLEIHEDVGVLKIDNVARRNALSPGVRDGLLQGVQRLVDDVEIRAVVLTGAGGHFCSGGDISNMTPMTLLQARRRLSSLHELVRTMIAGTKPFIAAVEGSAFGAGFSLALACDQIVAARGARFCASFGRVNLLADGGMLWTLPQRVGAHRARQLIALSTEVDASEAEKLGIVDRLVEPGAALDAALEVARRYRDVAPGALASVKAVFADGSLASLDGAFRAEVDHQAALRGTEDHRNAVEAFLGKKKPVFTGR
jgi:2-(1,2-epoxy-1,2-dihydrophenyl)acetyl-CoA isomerase